MKLFSEYISKGKILVMNRPLKLDGQEIPASLICGIVLDGDMVNGTINENSLVEMWDVEIQIRPLKKFTDNKEQGFQHLRIDQMLCSSWGSYESWNTQLLD